MNLKRTWENKSKQERLHILIAMGMSRKEAREIYAEKWIDLPKDIKAYG